ncbi:N/A [soil metagenome]
MSTDTDQQLAPQGGRPTRAVSEQIERRILDGAALLLLRDGYEETSMDAVAAEAGISKRTLYTRFPAKSQLFEAVIGDVVEQKMQLVATGQEEDISLGDELLAFAAQLHRIILVPEIIGLERVVISEAKHFPELAGRVLRRLGEIAIRQLYDIIRPALPNDRRSDALIYKDAEIFLALVVLPPMRNALLGRSAAGPYGVDRVFIARAVEIFVKGIRSGDGLS